MKKIGLESLRTIPVFIEDSRYEAPAWEAFECFRRGASQLGLTSLTLEFHNNKAKFESARKNAGFGIAAVEEWEYLNHFTGNRPMTSHWDQRRLKTCYYGVSHTTETNTSTQEITDLARGVVSFMKDCRFNTNIVYYRGTEIHELPEVEGAKSYRSDITPNTLMQKEIALIDAENSPIPVCQSPYASMSHNIVLDTSIESTRTRRWSATLERDSYTFVNQENSTHVGRPTKRGFEQLFTTLFLQAGTLPAHWQNR